MRKLSSWCIIAAAILGVFALEVLAIAETIGVNLTGLCQETKANPCCRRTGFKTFDWSSCRPPQPDTRHVCFHPSCPDSYVSVPKADGGPVWIGIHMYRMRAAKALCERLERLSAGTVWAVCTRGRHHGRTYRYFKFYSSKMAEQEAERSVNGLQRQFQSRALSKKVTLLAGQMDGAILATRIAARRPKDFPLLLLFVQDNGIRIWSNEAAALFAEGGGKKVLFVVDNCKRDGSCRRSEHLCTAFSGRDVRCKVFSIPHYQRMPRETLLELRGELGLPSDLE